MGSVCALTIIINLLTPKLTKEEILKNKNDSIQNSINVRKQDSLDAAKNLPVTCYLNLKDVVRKNCKDPESFVEVDHSYERAADGKIEVSLTYRATNSFGAYIQKNLVAKYDENGNTLSIEEN
ncbi:MAG: hypothetical protein L6262_02400 [Weeksellaceae bacterium]|nr:hypothetical protein [Weeksellaceae bacterium]